MKLYPTDSPNLIDCVADKQRYANLAHLFGYRPVTYTEIACAGWFRFRDGVFWLLFVEPEVVEVHISSLGVPDSLFFTQELEGAILAEAKALGATRVRAQDIDRRMAVRLKRLNWEHTGDFWEKKI